MAFDACIRTWMLPHPKQVFMLEDQSCMRVLVRSHALCTDDLPSMDDFVIPHALGRRMVTASPKYSSIFTIKHTPSIRVSVDYTWKLSTSLACVPRNVHHFSPCPLHHHHPPTLSRCRCPRQPNQCRVQSGSVAVNVAIAGGESWDTATEFD